MAIKADFSNKVAVITGGAGILCSTMGQALASCGAKVALLDLREESAKKEAEKINAQGGTAIGIGVDVFDVQALERARDQIIEQLGIPNILINGAGGNNPRATTGPDHSFFDMKSADVSFVFNLNFMGTFLPTQVFGKTFVEHDDGVIINIASMAAFTPLTRTPAYSAAKAAIVNLTQWLAVHFNQEYSKNIRVNAIAPGFLLTDQNRYLLTDEKTGEATQRGKDIIRATPMGKYGLPEDLTGAIIFLCSESSAFINGTVISIDGAFSAYSI